MLFHVWIPCFAHHTECVHSVHDTTQGASHDAADTLWFGKLWRVPAVCLEEDLPSCLIWVFRLQVSLVCSLFCGSIRQRPSPMARFICLPLFLRPSHPNKVWGPHALAYWGWGLSHMVLWNTIKPWRGQVSQVSISVTNVWQELCKNRRTCF